MSNNCNISFFLLKWVKPLRWLIWDLRVSNSGNVWKAKHYQRVGINRLCGSIAVDHPSKAFFLTGRNPELDQTCMWGGKMFALLCCFNRFVSMLRPGPNCYVNASRTQVIPAGEPAWIDSCTKCRCHDGQDAGYWEGNRLATCSRLRNCNLEETLPREKAIQQWSNC